MANFLDSTILPGENIPKHEHKKMTIVLVVVLIVAVILLAWFMVYGGLNTKVDIPSTEIVSNQKDNSSQVIAELKSYDGPMMTDKQKASAIKELSKYSAPLTDKQKAEMLAE